jgi:hypothetical protein
MQDGQLSNPKLKNKSLINLFLRTVMVLQREAKLCLQQRILD